MDSVMSVPLVNRVTRRPRETAFTRLLRSKRATRGARELRRVGGAFRYEFRVTKNVFDVGPETLGVVRLPIDSDFGQTHSEMIRLRDQFDERECAGRLKRDAIENLTTSEEDITLRIEQRNTEEVTRDPTSAPAAPAGPAWTLPGEVSEKHNRKQRRHEVAAQDWKWNRPGAPTTGDEMSLINVR